MDGCLTRHETVQQAEHDEHDGHGIEHREHRDGCMDDGVEPEIRHKEGGDEEHAEEHEEDGCEELADDVEDAPRAKGSDQYEYEKRRAEHRERESISRAVRAAERDLLRHGGCAGYRKERADREVERAGKHRREHGVHP